MTIGQALKLVPALGLAGALLLPSAGLAGSPVGVWQTEPMPKGGYAHIRIAPCAARSDRLCGKITEVFRSDRNDLVGVDILQDMAQVGQGTWGDGAIFSPDKNKRYDSQMELHDTGLEVRGCVAALCKSQRWARVE